MEGRPPFDPAIWISTSRPSERSGGSARQRASGRPRPRGEGPLAGARAPLRGSLYDTGESPDETGESGLDAGTGEDPFDTGERRRRRESRDAASASAGAAARSAATARPRRRTPASAGSRTTPTRPPRFRLGQPPQRRHRDLPANVRRRQAMLVGGAALAGVLVLVVVANAIFGGGGDDEDEPLPLKKLAGQTIIGKMGKSGPDRDLLRRVRKGQLGGVFVVPQDEQTLATQVAQLQQAASEGDNPQLLVMTDQEGGDVKQLPNGPPSVSAPEMGEAGGGRRPNGRRGHRQLPEGSGRQR